MRPWTWKFLAQGLGMPSSSPWTTGPPLLPEHTVFPVRRGQLVNLCHLGRETGPQEEEPGLPPPLTDSLN